MKPGNALVVDKGGGGGGGLLHEGEPAEITRSTSKGAMKLQHTSGTPNMY
jgi:hypothetical protein